MAQKRCGALLVMEGNQLLGIISERDYARKVRKIMSHPVICIAPELTVEQTMAVMTEKHVRHLPVLVDEPVVGVVSIGDVVREIIDEKEFYIQQLTSYITAGS